MKTCKTYSCRTYSCDTYHLEAADSEASSLNSFTLMQFEYYMPVTLIIIMLILHAYTYTTSWQAYYILYACNSGQYVPGSRCL